MKYSHLEHLTIDRGQAMQYPIHIEKKYARTCTQIFTFTLHDIRRTLTEPACISLE